MADGRSWIGELRRNGEERIFSMQELLFTWVNFNFTRTAQGYSNGTLDQEIHPLLHRWHSRVMARCFLPNLQLLCEENCLMGKTLESELQQLFFRFCYHSWWEIFCNYFLIFFLVKISYPQGWIRPSNS